MPSPSVATVGPRPAEPTSAFRTRSASDSITSRTSPSAPTSTSPSVHASAARAPASASASAMRRTPCSAACSTSASHERSALSPTSSRSGERATMSSACVPIEPVDPRMSRRRATSPVLQPGIKAGFGARGLPDARYADLAGAPRGRRDREGGRCWDTGRLHPTPLTSSGRAPCQRRSPGVRERPRARSEPQLHRGAWGSRSARACLRSRALQRAPMRRLAPTSRKVFRRVETAGTRASPARRRTRRPP